MDLSKNPLPEKTKIRGIYLLPNLLTTSALFAGFYAIIAAMKGYFDTAAIAVFVAMIADGLDGRVARMTNTQTWFGAEYDSLSDMLAFAVAPAVILYGWALSNLGKLGWLVAFVYTAATALRLARFNTQAPDEDKSYFQGLPSPPGAAVVMGMVWLACAYDVPGTFLAIPSAVIAVCVAGLMVSNIRYYSFKNIDFKGKVPFLAIVGVVLMLAAIAVDPPQMLFSVALIFACSGPVMTLWQLRQMRVRKKGNKNSI